VSLSNFVVFGMDAGLSPWMSAWADLYARKTKRWLCRCHAIHQNQNEPK